ncbi:hypothetical protein OS121_28820 [Mycolicibacterium mucogenicum]|jgi:hypothetical protein|uniref:hypothetical protein n=1 Tax=Mycolicibacterium mucogenicum TaxID=56689 RepID=UPI0013A534E4|nr:hypothetical protein [Mycolicibacterium mucogenicum]MCX8559048.1 hypothetical protein [Mycolicibacterium mucogenicum]
MTTTTAQNSSGEVWERIRLLAYDMVSLNQQMLTVNEEMGAYGDGDVLAYCRQKIDQSVRDCIEVLGELCGPEPDPSAWTS